VISDTLGAFALLCFTSLLALLNPLSVAPMYLSLTAGYPPAQQRRTLRNAILAGGVVLFTFASAGHPLSLGQFSIQ
jgi:small neutral amino acid transporter SnatA (MarC family)